MATDIKSSLKPAPRRTRSHRPYLFTSDQVLKMLDAEIIPDDIRTELLDGVLYQVTRKETHNLIVGQVGDLLRPLLPQNYHLREEKSTRSDDFSLPEPDLAVCRGGRKDDWPDLPGLDRLALVVEVSQNSARADRVVKFEKYAASNVLYYWIIDVDDRSVGVWTRPTRLGGKSSRYDLLVTYTSGQTIPVEIDGDRRGEIGVDDIFPPSVI